jgi:hypothetical protein
MLEAYTAPGALATATERVQLGTPATGNNYRNDIHGMTSITAARPGQMSDVVDYTGFDLGFG